MEWRRSKGGGRGVSWLKGNWIVDYGDRSHIANTLLQSKGIWYPKGVLEIYVNTYYGFRMNPVKSARSIGRALKALFGTEGGFICDVSAGKEYAEYVWQRVAWYARCPEKPDISKMEKVLDTVSQHAVEQEYIAVVKSTGETEYYVDSELPGLPSDKHKIRKWAFNPPEKPRVVQGRYWRVASEGM